MLAALDCAAIRRMVMAWLQADSANVRTAASTLDRIARRNNPKQAPNVAPAVVGVHLSNQRFAPPSLCVNRVRLSDQFIAESMKPDRIDDEPE